MVFKLLVSLLFVDGYYFNWKEWLVSKLRLFGFRYFVDIVLKIVKVGLYFEGIIDNICFDNKLWVFKRKLEFVEI